MRRSGRAGRRVVLVAGALAVLLLGGAGCKSATDRFDAYDILVMPPLDVSPAVDSKRDVGEDIRLATLVLARKHRVFPVVTDSVRDMPGGSKALRIDATVTMYRRGEASSVRWVDPDRDGSVVRVDVRFVDHETGRFVDQRFLEGEAPGVAVPPGSVDPAIAKVADKIVRHLFWNKSNKPYDRE